MFDGLRSPDVKDTLLVAGRSKARRLVAIALTACILAGTAGPPLTAAPVIDEYEWSEAAFARWRPIAGTFDAAKFREALAAYAAGSIPAGDTLAATQTDPDAITALEWAAIRNARATLGYDRLSRFLTAHPDFPMAGWIRRRAESALLDEGRSDSIVTAFFGSREPETAAGRIVLARAKRNAGDFASAAILIRRAWRENTITPGLETAILRDFADAIGPDDIRYRAERLVFRHELTEALRVAQRFGPDYALLLRAVHATLTDAGDAAALTAAVPPTETKRAMYSLAKATMLRRTGHLAEAAEVMRAAPRAANDLVSPEDWWTERRLLARKLLDAGDPTNAYAVASAYRATADATRIEAEFHAGWIALRFLHDAEAAEVHFARAARMARTPLSLSRSHYWWGRALDALNRPSNEIFAQAAFHATTFYGQLAAERLGRTEIALRGVPVSDEARKAYERRAGTRVIRLFLDNNARDLALPLALDDAQTLDTDDVMALGDLVAGYRDSNLLLTLAKAAHQRGLPVDRLAFPIFGIPVYAPVEGSAERALVYAIARQESAFNPKAVSHAGARGLMQMMPATASATARQFMLPYSTAQLTDEPAANVRLGAAHLGHLVKSMRGSYALVFSGYNAGPGRVKDWIEAYGDPRDPATDMIDWIERIPISETRNYVQRVMENVQVYRVLLGNGPSLTLRADLARGVRQADLLATGTLPKAFKSDR